MRYEDMRTLGYNEFKLLCNTGRLRILEAKRLPGETISWEEHCVLLIVEDMETGEICKYLL
jgi:hypothetical protein